MKAYHHTRSTTNPKRKRSSDLQNDSGISVFILQIFGFSILWMVSAILWASFSSPTELSSSLSLSLSLGSPVLIPKTTTNTTTKISEKPKHQQQQHHQQQPIKESTTTSNSTTMMTGRSTIGATTFGSSSATATIQPNDINIDIISVGSQKELNLFSAQKETFGRHQTVRNFYSFTELDDHERNCYIDLNETSWGFISDFCRTQINPKYEELYRFRSRFANRMHIGKKGTSASGWFCAFKRPAESLYKVLKGYTTSTATAAGTGTIISKGTTANETVTGGTQQQQWQRTSTTTNDVTNSTTATTTIPEYLFLLDADTYLNLNNIVGIVSNNSNSNSNINNISTSSNNEGGGEREQQVGGGRYGGFLPTSYPPDSTLVIAGCMIRERVKEHNFTFPWGGFGTVFTRRSIEKFIKPIHNCRLGDDDLIDPKTNQSLKTMSYRELTDDEFERLVCSKIKEDMIGEFFLFETGMSVADLMYKYVTHWKFVNAEQHWKRTHPRDYNKAQTTGGFCMHADWVIGYFVNQYYLSKHQYAKYFKNNPDNRFLGYNGSEFYAGYQKRRNLLDRKECLNDNDSNCNPQTAHFCHHVSAAKMRELSTVL